MSGARKPETGAYDGSKKYVVWFEDEYCNIYLIGFFDDLGDALPQANAFLSQYKSDPSEECEDESQYVTIRLGEDSPFGTLREENGTMGPSLGREFATPCGCVSIRGFVLR